MTRLLAGLFCLMLMTVTVHAADTMPGTPHLRVANRDVRISSENSDLLVKKVRPYAAMSELAYRTYSTVTPKQKIVQKEVPRQRAEGWDQLDAWLTQQHWEFLGHKEHPGGDTGGEPLSYDLWMNQRAVPPQLVVAFRGTEGDDYDSDHDRYTAIHQPEFREDILAACGTAGPDVVVSATGHALGGDLAQHLFYFSQIWPTNQVTQVTVFGPSPLTGSNEFGSDEERRKAMSYFNASLAAATTRWRFPEVMAYQYGFGIIRVNERDGDGTLLSLLRPGQPEENYVAALDFELEDGPAVNRHEMARLAQTLHYYPAAPPAPPKDPRAVLPADAGAAELYRLLNQS